MKRVITKIVILTLLILASIAALFIHRHQLETIETNTKIIEFLITKCNI